MTLRDIQTLAGLSLLLLLPAKCRAGAPTQAAARSESASSNSAPAPQRLSAGGEEFLRNFVNSAELPDLHWPKFENYRKEVKEFYDAAGGGLPWIDRGKPTAQARAIVQSLKTAADKGLRAEDYDGPQWDGRLAKFDQASAVPESDLVKFDLALTVSTMRYISDLHIGRVNPRLFHFGLDFDNGNLDLSEILRQDLLGANNVGAVFDAIEPPFPIYRRTENALKKYRELAGRDVGVLLPVPARAVKAGDSYAAAPRLAKLLALVGDLPEGQAQWTGNYQGALVAAVKHFQQRHGLEPNGVLDARTLKQMNTPLSRRVTQLQLAMERMRWLPHHFQRPPIVVNIPEFRLYALNDDYRSALSMKVVVGKAFGHQTPVFANQIKSVIFRPYWNVPVKHRAAELLRDLEKNPSYLANNAYEIVDRREWWQRRDGRPSIGGTASRRELRVRQTPGPKNALGLVKFEFPNDYDVYLHGTPSPELFSRSRRDFSHGCIRVENPVALAEWVLQGIPEWTEDKIRAAMNGEETLQVKLAKPIPVLIFYGTAVVMEDEIRFTDDIYGLDAKLERALAGAKP